MRICYLNGEHLFAVNEISRMCVRRTRISIAHQIRATVRARACALRVYICVHMRLVDKSSVGPSRCVRVCAGVYTCAPRHISHIK